MIGRIAGGDEAAYRREVASLVSWCEENNLTLNTDKTKEMIVDMRKERRTPQPLFIRELEVERVRNSNTWVSTSMRTSLGHLTSHSWSRRLNSGCIF